MAVSQDSRIAIVGMSGRFPGAPDLDAFWRVIAEGRDTLTRFDRDEIGADDTEPGETYVRARGVLEGIEDFDASFFEFRPEEAAQLDPQHRLWLEVAWEALESAGYAHDRHDQVVGVYAGSYMNTYLYHNLLPDRTALEQFVRMRRTDALALLVQNDPAYLPSRTAYKLDLHGPAVNVQTACSTSLVAVAMAVQALRAGDTDLAIAGGVCVAVPQRVGYFFQEGSLHSRDGVCRPYDASASGTVFSNGAGAVVLKRLEDALRDRDPIWAVIRGAGVNNDGRGKASYHSPSVQGQAGAIALAQEQAGVEAGTIGYVEGHGTATPVGDPIEVEALKLGFRSVTRKQSCCLGSAKGNVGHLDVAAGVTGLIRAVLALHHRQLPATAHFERPNPDLKLEDSPFFVTSRTLPWPEGPTPRRAAVSAFGIGGTNAHVILEEAPPVAGAPRDTGAREETTLLLSARQPEALDAATARLAGWVEAQCAGGSAPWSLREVAAALQQRRKRFRHRRAIRVESWEDARAALRDPTRWSNGSAVEGRPRLVFSLTGQGSVQAGALAALLAEEPALAHAFEPLARAASDLAGFDLLRWAADPQADAAPLRRDNATAQLATFCVGVALARWLESRGVVAQGFLGHSLGEWVGAHLAGVFSAEDALRAIHERGRLMQQTGPGAALVVHLSEADLGRYLGSGVTLACANAPDACLVSGRPQDVRRCAERLAAAGVGHRAAPIDVAVHSPYMEPVVTGLRAFLPSVRLSAPLRPLLSSVTGAWMTQEAAVSIEYWASQPRLPVRFGAAVATLFQEPSCVVLEVGQGDALTTLASAQLRDGARHRALALLGQSRAGSDPGPRRLARALQRLWASGVEVDLLGELEQGAQAPRLPVYPFQRRRCWKEAPVRREEPARNAGEHEAPPSPVAQPVCGPDMLESLLALIQEMSGVPRAALDPGVPFSSLGLDSIFLVQLAETLSVRHGLRVSFSQLAQFNTARTLAAALEAQAPPVRAIAAPTRPAAPSGFRGLFPLRRGDDRLPILLIHGDVANDFLPARLPPEQTIFGYGHQGSDGERIELRSVDDLAARCFSEWTASFKGVPCVVAGHSFGGLVAHSLVDLMRREGMPVELLMLIDAYHPRCFREPVSAQLPAAAARGAPHLGAAPAPRRRAPRRPRAAGPAPRARLQAHPVRAGRL